MRREQEDRRHRQKKSQMGSKVQDRGGKRVRLQNDTRGKKSREIEKKMKGWTLLGHCFGKYRWGTSI